MSENTNEGTRCSSPVRYQAEALSSFSRNLLTAAGLPAEKATAVAEILLEGDLLGHDTHGLALLAGYLRELESGFMEKEGGPSTLSDRESALVWDGRYLPGPWLVKQAITLACDRIQRHPAVIVTIQRSHHIACLQAYLKPVTEAGYMILLTCSDPSIASVAPHGGVTPCFTPNPIAVGWPTAGVPVLIDISSSTTTNAMTRRLYDKQERLPGPWVVDSRGHSTDDPGVLFGQPPGAVLPLGGTDLGHKGFALAMVVEALTSALAGYGRKDNPGRWGASVFLMLLDPQCFGGREAFLQETVHLAAVCRQSAVPPGGSPVRIPGEGALARRSRQLSEGITLYPSILPALIPWAEKLGVGIPQPLP